MTLRKDEAFGAIDASTLRQSAPPAMSLKTAPNRLANEIIHAQARQQASPSGPGWEPSPPDASIVVRAEHATHVP
jgi:hypothetical protein